MSYDGEGFGTDHLQAGAGALHGFSMFLIYRCPWIPGPVSCALVAVSRFTETSLQMHRANRCRSAGCPSPSPCAAGHVRPRPRCTQEFKLVHGRIVGLAPQAQRLVVGLAEQAERPARVPF